jgi:hypothetical protein
VPAKQTGNVIVIAEFDGGPISGSLRAKRTVAVMPAS